MAQNLSQEVLYYLKGICCPATPVVTYNFDVESSDWTGAGITDKASFESAFGVTVSDFLISGNKIEAKILSVTNDTLNFWQTNVTKVNYITYLVKNLTFDSCKISNFNPVKPLPDGLETLDLTNTDFTIFNPTYPLPSSLIFIGFENNELTNANYTSMESWANSQTPFINNCDISFNLNIDHIAGTNLKTILTSKNCTVTS